MDVLLRWLPGEAAGLCFVDNLQLAINLASLPPLRGRGLARRIGGLVRSAQRLSTGAGKRLVACVDLRPLSGDFSASGADSIDLDMLDRCLDAVVCYRSLTRALPKVRLSSHSSALAEYDVDAHPALLRFGNVELRVLQNYLNNREALRTACRALTAHLDDERTIYAPARATSYLTADDPDWNLRRLMTNAGFYMPRDPDLAWDALENWVRRYFHALEMGHLAWHNEHARYFLKVQCLMARRTGFVPQFVRPPDPFRIYSQLSGKRVLFLSPLAHLAQEQASTGRLRRLYKSREVPSFSLASIPAYISTWPNRPHSGWTETFGHLCKALDAARQRKEFDVFIASCGSYGLPICAHVRERYGCAVLYLGNFAHALFGIHQKSTRTTPDMNAEMWVNSDLGHYPHMDRIDLGSYT